MEFINYPIEGLDINSLLHENSPYKKENNLYDLVAVSAHIGNTNSGHYTTTAKNCEDAKWYVFDDDRVYPA